MSNKAEKKVYQETIELFNGCCAICGNNQIHCHHIRYGGLYGGRKTYMGNVIPLCEKHHRLAHTNKRKYMPILIEVINKAMKRG